MHSPLSIWTLERVLTETQPKRIIELGTGSGLLTIYLAMWARLNQARVITYDHQLIEEGVLHVLRDLSVTVRTADILSGESDGEIRKSLHSDNRVLLYCDNGRKMQELATFAPLLKRNDILGCHDYRTEVQPKVIGPTLEALGYVELVDTQLMADLYTLQMFWERVS
jgi:cephalosporin hydroxylase